MEMHYKQFSPRPLMKHSLREAWLVHIKPSIVAIEIFHCIPPLFPGNRVSGFYACVIVQFRSFNPIVKSDLGHFIPPVTLSVLSLPIINSFLAVKKHFIITVEFNSQF